MMPPAASAPRAARAAGAPYSPERLDALLDRLLRYYPRGIDLSLDRIRLLLADLGDPQLRLPPVIHVAGTNGKGSTIAFLRAFFEASGRSCHVYTSPHLVRFNERIRLAGDLIGGPLLYDTLMECERVNAGRPVTFFEITTAAAFLAFSRVPADICLLETGMGGILDATNLVPDPLATVITTISMDHTDYLGDTLQQIAAEKAGIMKAGRPCVVGWQTPDGVAAGIPELFKNAAAKLNAPIFFYDIDFNAKNVDQNEIELNFCSKKIRLPRPNLTGPHQIRNAAAALAVLEIAHDRFPFTQAQLAAGIGRAEWPARLQRLTAGPLAAELPPGWELWLDGGHNDSAGLILAEQCAEWQETDPAPLYVVCAMLTTKKPEEFFRPLVPYLTGAVAVPIQGEALSFDPVRLAERIRLAGVGQVSAAMDAAEGMSRCIEEAHGNTKGRILLAGSLYFSGQVLGNARL